MAPLKAYLKHEVLCMHAHLVEIIPPLTLPNWTYACQRCAWGTWSRGRRMPTRARRSQLKTQRTWFRSRTRKGVCVILLIISHQCQPCPLKVDVWQSLQPKRWHEECLRNNSMSINRGDRQWVQLNHFCVWPDQQRQDFHHARDGGGRWGGLVFKTYLFKITCL